jgi:hypothetical protein
MVNRPPLWYFLLSTVTATNALASCYDIKWLLDSISIIVFRVDFIQSNQNQIIATCRFHSSHYSRSQKLSLSTPRLGLHSADGSKSRCPCYSYSTCCSTPPAARLYTSRIRFDSWYGIFVPLALCGTAVRACGRQQRTTWPA